MTPSFHPELVNGRTGDPALFVDFRFEKRGMLFDLGDLHALAPAKLHRLSHVFVSHAHIDHFIGFDQLVRVLLGRAKHIRLYGPDGFADRVGGKLSGYAWNLVDRFTTDLTFTVMEVRSETAAERFRFRLKNRFQRETLGGQDLADGQLVAGDGFQVEARILDHKIPSLGFALSEPAHVNIWRNRLNALGLPVGPWLQTLKQAVLRGCGDETSIRYEGQVGTQFVEGDAPLGFLKREVLKIVPGQKIAYVTDIAYTEANSRKVRALARGADILFIEAVFAGEDWQRASERAHLTADQAGRLAREAGVRAVEPFHFSPRYADAETRLLREVRQAFRQGGGAQPAPLRSTVETTKEVDRMTNATSPVTGATVARLFGDIDDHKVTEILALKPTFEDLEAAAAFLAQADDVMGEHRQPPSGAIGQILDIVAEDEEPE